MRQHRWFPIRMRSPLLLEPEPFCRILVKKLEAVRSEGVLKNDKGDASIEEEESGLARSGLSSA